jgi:hypothetical protein
LPGYYRCESCEGSFAAFKTLLQVRFGFLLIPSFEIVVELAMIAGGVGALAWVIWKRARMAGADDPGPDRGDVTG